MGKGGGSPGPQTSKVYNTNLPEYAAPYYKNMMARAETETNQPYIAYGAPRIAGFTGDQQGAFQGIRNINALGAPTVDTAAGMAYGAGNVGAQASGFNPYYTNTGNWTNANVGAYMNPYIQNVLRTMQDTATGRFQEQAGQRDTAAQQAGAYGGSRQAISNFLAQRDLNSQLNSMNAEQLAQAYQNAQGMYTSDQARALQSDQGNQAALAQAAGIRLQGGQLGLQSAQSLGQLGQMQQGLAFDRLAALEKAGVQQQGLAQSALDQAYKDFINQRDYERQNLQFLTGIMHGVPVTAQSETLGYEAPPNPVNQLLGLGIAGNQLSGMMSSSSAPKGTP
jgi:hypothetical protein